MLIGCGCQTRPLLLQGADAAADLLREIFGVHVGPRDRIRKVVDPNPLTKPGFVSIVAETAGALLKVARPFEQVVLASVLRKLEARDWYRLNEEQQGKAIEQAMGAIVGVSEIVAPKVRDVLQAVGKDVVLGTKAHGAKAWELDVTPTFEAVDMAVVNHIAASQAFYIRNQYGQREEALSAVARQVVADGVKEGLDKYDIAKNMKTALDGTSAQRSQGYYAMVASVFTARARSYGTLSSFEECGIEEYEISASLDEASCNACRLMDGRTFSVSVAMGAFQKIAESDDPESVVEAQPFLGTMRRDDGGLAVYYKSGGDRHTVAHVEESAVGQKDDKGSFSKVMSRGGLEKAGVTTPPYHPSCRCLCVMSGLTESPRATPDAGASPPPPPTIAAPQLEAPTPESEETFAPAVLPANLHELVRPVPNRTENVEVTPAGTPAENAAAASKLKEQAIVEAALAKLAALPASTTPGSLGFVEHGLPHQPPDADGDYAFPFTHGKKGDVTPAKLAGAAKQKAKDVPLTSITLVSPDVLGTHVALGIITNDARPTALLVKKGGVLYPATMKDQGTIVAAHLRGESVVKTKTIDLDKAAKTPKPAGAAPVIPPAPVTLPSAASAPAPRTAPHQPATGKPLGDAANILHHKDGDATGSNPGGFYTGADGVKRYVKFYGDPRQAHCEHITNQIYAGLGFASPDSQLFEHNGKLAYSSVLFDGGKTLRDIGHSKERSLEILKGFVADAFTANWDAVGVGNNGGDDNIFFLKNGKAVRIDTGGSLLMKGLGGPKPVGALNQLSEWEKFFDPSVNKNYARVAAGAGVHSVDDMAATAVEGIRSVLALGKQHGSWTAFVEHASPTLDPTNKARIAEMLTARAKLLEEHLAELTAPKPAPGSGRYVARSVGSALPRPGLALSDLEQHDAYEVWRKAQAKPGYDKMPSGELKSAYKARAAAAVAKAKPEEVASVVRFTDGTFGEVRDSEEKGAPSHAAKLIADAFKRVPAEPGTIFRGIHMDPTRAHKFPTGMPLEERRASVRGVVDQFLTQSEWGLGKGGVGATSSASWDVGVAANNFMNGVSEPDAHSYKILFKLNQRTGIPIETISDFKSENEVLLSRHARFRTTGVYKLKGYERILVVEAEEI